MTGMDFIMMPDMQQMPPSPEEDDSEEEPCYGLEKADNAVQYKMADSTSPGKCGGCRFFCNDGSCTIVEGLIEADHVCNLYRGQPVLMGEIYTIAGKTSETETPGYQLFLEWEGSANQPPDWIPYLPKPGVFKHPRYGTVSITPERNSNFVNMFKQKVYQEKLPLDAEHQTKLSGALGWITDMRLNTDGSADAQVEWTSRGKTLVQDNRFKYVSPEWYDSWTDPATEKVYENVVIGGALTTKPFFKETSLRPLIASENGITVLSPEGTREMQFSRADTGKRSAITRKKPDGALQKETYKEAVMSDNQVVEVQMSEDVQRQFTELKGALEAAQKERDEARSMSEQLAAKVDQVSRSQRRMQFTALVTGAADDTDHLRWFGETDQQVSMLERLADAFGEDSDTFKEYVAQQKAYAEQMKSSSLFSEKGSDARTNGTSTLTQRVASRVAEIRSKNPDLSIGEAQAQVFAENPVWYEEYRKTNTVRV